ncbi:serine hydrolase domain-containing protein [Alkanindiges sp. WGS2144]|uniref:serine hydrolase domain-containing protein n=1 Tax=Alkanindiges sp. WGS2144 TaxID=3366808 RepID=UPI0037507F98
MNLQHLLGAVQVQLEGHYDESFAPLVNTFKKIQPPTGRGGSALAVYFKGQKVVDVWTGQLKDNTAWQQDSMALSFSTGKAALATLVHRLADQGLLDYDQRVAYYWPEFGKNGKEHISLRHVLSHQSGLFDIRQNIQSAAQMLDWEEMLQVYEKASPRFEPGSQTAYQALSFGWLLGGMIEKVTGQRICEIFQKELVEPLGLDGAYFGVPTNELDRVARPILPPNKPDQDKAVNKPAKKHLPLLPNGRRPLTLQEKALKLTGLDPYEAEDALMPKGISRFSFFTDRALQACIPAANGVFTARSLAKMYAMLVNQGEIDGQQYLSPGCVRLLSEVQTTQRDRIMTLPMNWRLGYHRVLTLGKRVPQGFGHIGYNGSGAWCDPARELSFAYVHNFAGSSITGDPRLWWFTQTALQNADFNLTGKKSWR